MPYRVMVGLLTSQKLNNITSFIAAVAAMLGAWYLTNYSDVHQATYRAIKVEVESITSGVEQLKIQLEAVQASGIVNRQLLEATQEQLEAARLQVKQLGTQQNEMMREDDLLTERIRALEITIEDIQQKLKLLLENLPPNKTPTTHGLWWSGRKFRS